MRRACTMRRATTDSASRPQLLQGLLHRQAAPQQRAQLRVPALKMVTYRSPRRIQFSAAAQQLVAPSFPARFAQTAACGPYATASGHLPLPSPRLTPPAPFFERNGHFHAHHIGGQAERGSNPYPAACAVFACRRRRTPRRCAAGRPAHSWCTARQWRKICADSRW